LSGLITALVLNVDDPKTDTKQKIKATSLAQQLHNRLFEFKKMQHEITQLAEYAQKIMQKEQEIEKREKALRDFVKGDALTHDKILEEIKSRQQTPAMRISCISHAILAGAVAVDSTRKLTLISVKIRNVQIQMLNLGILLQRAIRLVIRFIYRLMLNLNYI
jgi:response regulator of citrate/malate metabolism